MKKIIASLSFLFIVYAATAQQWDGPNSLTSTISRTGSVGIGTSMPVTLFDVKKGIDLGNTSSNFVAPYFLGISNDYILGQAQQYLILTPFVGSTTGQPSAGLSGKLTFYRGHETSSNIPKEYNVTIQSAYSNSVYEVQATNYNTNVVNIYKLNYNNVPYIAIKVSEINSSGAAINFIGHYWNNINSQKPQLVSESLVNNISIIKDYQSIGANLVFADVAGNIGVGTNNPAEKLSINGTVLAKKVKVSTAAADWPDYVFDPLYPLPSLTSVASFIAVNKHLPGVPSAEEVATKGQDIGFSQVVLLKKVEELTLYIIEQDKKLSYQSQQLLTLMQLLQQQQEEIKALQKKKEQP